MNEITDWDDAYANGKYIAGAADYPIMWEADAARFRADHVRKVLNLAYGDHPRQMLDLFHPNDQPVGLAVFVHGGYWMNFDKSFWSHLAQGALAHGWAVAVPSYRLAPLAEVDQITIDIANAIAFAAEKVAGPIRVAGHSAGGHLVSRMGCKDTPLIYGAAARIQRIISISGLHDLRPLLKTALNETLGLTDETARAESPVLLEPSAGIKLTACVGQNERPEFLRQSEIIVDKWRDSGICAELVVEPRKHHFDVIEGLADPSAPLAIAFAGPEG